MEKESTKKLQTNYSIKFSKPSASSKNEVFEKFEEDLKGISMEKSVSEKKEELKFTDSIIKKLRDAKNEYDENKKKNKNEKSDKNESCDENDPTLKPRPKSSIISVFRSKNKSSATSLTNQSPTLPAKSSLPSPSLSSSLPSSSSFSQKISEFQPTEGSQDLHLELNAEEQPSNKKTQTIKVLSDENPLFNKSLLSPSKEPIKTPHSDTNKDPDKEDVFSLFSGLKDKIARVSAESKGILDRKFHKGSNEFKSAFYIPTEENEVDDFVSLSSSSLEKLKKTNSFYSSVGKADGDTKISNKINDSKVSTKNNTDNKVSNKMSTEKGSRSSKGSLFEGDSVDKVTDIIEETENNDNNNNKKNIKNDDDAKSKFNNNNVEIEMVDMMFSTKKYDHNSKINFKDTKKSSFDINRMVNLMKKTRLKNKKRKMNLNNNTQHDKSSYKFSFKLHKNKSDNDDEGVHINTIIDKTNSILNGGDDDDDEGDDYDTTELEEEEEDEDIDKAFLSASNEDVKEVKTSGKHHKHTEGKVVDSNLTQSLSGSVGSVEKEPNEKISKKKRFRSKFLFSHRDSRRKMAAEFLGLNPKSPHDEIHDPSHKRLLLLQQQQQLKAKKSESILKRKFRSNDNENKSKNNDSESNAEDNKTTKISKDKKEKKKEKTLSSLFSRHKPASLTSAQQKNNTNNNPQTNTEEDKPIQKSDQTAIPKALNTKEPKQRIKEQSSNLKKHDKYLRVLEVMLGNETASLSKLMAFLIVVFSCLFVTLPTYLLGLFTGIIITIIYTWISKIYQILFRPPKYISHSKEKHYFLDDLEDGEEINNKHLVIKDNYNNDGCFKGWLNELNSLSSTPNNDEQGYYEYSPENYRISMTHSVYATLDGTCLRLQTPKQGVARRRLANKETTNTVVFVKQRHFDMACSVVSLLPRQIVAKRYWSKKYPICIEFDDVDSGKGTSENNETKCLNAELEDETVDTETKLDDNDVKMTARDKLSKLKKRITHKGQKNSSKGVNQHQNPLYSALSTKTTTPTTLTKTITTTTTTTATSTKPPSSSKTTPKPSIAKPPSSRSSNLAPLTTVNPHSDPLSSCSDIMADVKEEEEEEDDDLKSNKTPFRLYLFSRTCREKEEWYRRLKSASLGRPWPIKLADLSLEKEEEEEEDKVSADKSIKSRLQEKDKKVQLKTQKTDTKDQNFDASPQARLRHYIDYMKMAHKKLTKEFYKKSLNMLLDDVEEEKDLMSHTKYDDDDDDDDDADVTPSYSDGNEMAPLDTKPPAPGGRGKHLRSALKRKNKRQLQSNHSSLLPSKHLLWVNMFVSRLFMDFIKDDYWVSKIKEKIQKKLSKIHVPYIMDQLVVTGIDLGPSMPSIIDTGTPYLDDRGFWVDLKIEYDGGFCITMETKCNLMKLKKQNEPDDVSTSTIVTNNSTAVPANATYNSDVNNSTVNTAAATALNENTTANNNNNNNTTTATVANNKNNNVDGNEGNSGVKSNDTNHMEKLEDNYDDNNDNDEEEDEDDDNNSNYNRNNIRNTVTTLSCSVSYDSKLRDVPAVVANKSTSNNIPPPPSTTYQKQPNKKLAALHSDEEDSAESSTDDDHDDDGLDDDADESKKSPQKPLGKRLLNWMDRISQSKYFQQVVEYKYIKKAFEGVSNTRLELNIEVKSVVGSLALNVPPPPTDRLWYGFRANPRLELAARPRVGKREVNLVPITEWIEKKLALEFQRVFVLPNMDDIKIPLMLDHMGK